MPEYVVLKKCFYQARVQEEGDIVRVDEGVSYPEHLFAPVAEPKESESTEVHASAAAIELAQEHGIDLALVEPTGRTGITKTDVANYIESLTEEG